MDRILVTGSCGFIGMSLIKKLLKNGHEVLGLDNMNSYYDVKLKKGRLNELSNNKSFEFRNVDIRNYDDLFSSFKNFEPDKVVNLAAQVGVRYSLQNPHAYLTSNLNGFLNILECSRHHNTKGLIYASSSSVYGGNKKSPFSVKHRVDNPISIYAATKKSNELMANVYSHLYDLNTTGLRFFTVYGPWGRPDMAMYIFTKKIINNEPIPIYNFGKMKRDFTFIDDIVNGIISSIELNYSCEVFNLGNNKTEELMKVVGILERCLKKKAKVDFQPIQAGDVQETFSDIKYTQEKLSYKPSIDISKGIPLFISWYKNFYLIK